MPILTIRHVTAYHYRKPVAFGEHRIMLRPRNDEDQKVLESELEIAPAAGGKYRSQPTARRGAKQDAPLSESRQLH